MSEDKAKWIGHSYLDGLRPDYGWEVEIALLATYSADPIVIGAALLALSGFDDDERGSGSKIDFANAVEQLRGKVRIICQAGRLISPKKCPRIVGILDQFIREVSEDESTASWHPKIALIKYREKEGAGTTWRLWLGSRNLTKDMSRDVGLLLTESDASRGIQIPALQRIGESLATNAQLDLKTTREVAQELSSVFWRAPRDCELQDIRLLEDRSHRGLPEVGKEISHLTVVSPFIDHSILKRMAKWGNSSTVRWLVSNRTELDKLNASGANETLKQFDELLCFDAPEEPTGELESEESSEEREEFRGLHAKLILAESKRTTRVWLGSANATDRGWNGPNTEAIADLVVADSLAEGLTAFLKENGRSVALTELSTAPVGEDEIEKELEQARKEVATNWKAVIESGRAAPILRAENTPHPTNKSIDLRAELLGREPIVWPRNSRELELAPATPAEFTELVVCRLSLGDESVEWLLRADLSSPPDRDRDSRMIARFLDPKTFLQWIKSLLTDIQSDGTGDWDDEGPKKGPTIRKHTPLPTWLPTLEEVLKAWNQDPELLKSVDRKIQDYFHHLDQSELQDINEDERRALDQFHRTWGTIRKQLVAA